MNILDKIINQKKSEVEALKAKSSVSEFKESPLYHAESKNLVMKLAYSDFGVIAEYKRKSPSKGMINENATLEVVIPAYDMAGVAAVSVLTDSYFFGGGIDDLKQARSLTNLAILRKDFMIDSLQLHESKAAGANVILLIARMLAKTQLEDLAAEAKAIGLEVLLEIHDRNELVDLDLRNIDLIGVNNRNLDTFETDAKRSLEVVGGIPQSKIKISESGLDNPEIIMKLISAGYKGFLIGESFMKESDPGKACHDLINKLGHAEENY